MRIAISLCVIGIFGCGPKPRAAPTPAPAPAHAPAAPDSASDPAPDPAPDIVAPPFTAAELRAGLPAGTEIKLRVESANSPAVIQHWIFTAADETGCTIQARVYAEDGTLIEDQGSGTSTWDELESHAHFPAALTTREDASIDVPAGHFDTWLFEVKPAQPGAASQRLHFARSLPGPPVWMEVVKDGVVLTKLELLSRTQP